MSAQDTGEVQGTTRNPPPAKRIPALDGLRGLAVAAVMLFHTASSPLKAGFLGVDVFFVLSGFLIAGLLVDEYQGRGHIRLGRFWLRRARRLAPALLLLLIFVALGRLARPVQAVDEGRVELLAALTYTTNWLQILEGRDYFEQFGRPSVLQHTWSLAIEEQFYIGLALLLVWLLPRVKRGRLTVGLAGLVVLSAGSMVVAGLRGDLVWAYYGTIPRIQALLVGVVLSLTMHRWDAGGRLRTAREPLGWVALGGLLLLFFLGNEENLFRGGFTGAALLAALMIWAVVGGGRLAALFSWRPLVALGVVSYGVYLWHWPVFLWLQTPPVSVGLEFGSVVVTLIIATVSYVVVEKPVRTGAFTRLRPARQWRTYAFASLAIAAVALLPARTIPASDQPLQWPPAEQVPGVIATSGDSTVLTLNEHFPRDRYPHAQLAGAVKLGCGFAPGPFYKGDRVEDPPQCASWEEDWAGFARDYPAQVAVIGSQVWDLFDRQVDGVRQDPSSEPYTRMFVEGFRSAASMASREGETPTYVLGIPCMASIVDGDVLNDPARRARANGLIREAVDGMPNVHFVDLEPLTCRDGGRVRDVGGAPIFRDGVHWSESGALAVWSLVLQQVAADGVISPEVSASVTP